MFHLAAGVEGLWQYGGQAGRDSQGTIRRVVEVLAEERKIGYKCETNR